MPVNMTKIAIGTYVFTEPTGLTPPVIVRETSHDAAFITTVTLSGQAFGWVPKRYLYPSI